MSTLQWLYSDAKSRDRAVFSFCDTLDVKTGILLVVIVFLAGITGQLLSLENPPRFLMLVQSLCASGLILSGVLTIYELWPRTYLMEDQDRTSQLKCYFDEYPQTETDPIVLEEILRSNISSAVTRIAHNHSINLQKSTAFAWAFHVVVTVIGLEIASAILLAFCRLASPFNGHVL